MVKDHTFPFFFCTLPLLVIPLLVYSNDGSVVTNQLLRLPSLIYTHSLLTPHPPLLIAQPDYLCYSLLDFCVHRLLLLSSGAVTKERSSFRHPLILKCLLPLSHQTVSILSISERPPGVCWRGPQCYLGVLFAHQFAQSQHR